MTLQSFLARARRALRKPPGQLARRIAVELRHEFDRFTQPRFGRRFDLRQLLERTGARDLDALWTRLLATPGWPFAAAPSAADYERCCPGDCARIVAAAERALRHEIDLLGSGPKALGPRIDWQRDYKTGDRWPGGYFRGIDYLNPGRPSDVKTAWELSRLQWLLPCGQAYALTGEERYAAAARAVLEQWIDANPYAFSVNWGVTMEPALRIFGWGELLRLCGASASWADAGFRARFLAALYLHALFTERYIERSDVNGNHFTADAAALVLAGALFGTGRDAGRWLTAGLADLEHEILVQVHPDGVDFEASTAYHRLVAELFLAASMAGAACGCATSAPYRQRLAAMARFTSVYMRPDSTAPLWGDHDDARVLPLGPQGIRDHRYLVGLIGLHLGDAELLALAGGPRAEGCWWFGPGAAARLTESAAPVASAAFRAGGVYVMRGARDHVFIDCGPLGLADRGGHGHNDLLSFEAFLDGVPVVTEGGCYVYTADFASRNRDRATRSHNTPLVDGAEINRFVAPEQLWTLTADAGFEAGEFTVTPGRVRFRGSHSGYRRLPGPVSVMRTIDYDATTAELIVSDRLEGEGVHEVEIPLHLEPGIALRACGERALELKAGPTSFELSWSGAGFSLAQEESRVATSYGVARVGPLLVWRASGALPLELRVAIARATVVSTARAGAAP